MQGKASSHAIRVGKISLFQSKCYQNACNLRGSLLTNLFDEVSHSVDTYREPCIAAPQIIKCGA